MQSSFVSGASAVRFLWITLLLAGTLLFAPGVRAHARVVKAAPANKSELAKSPERVELWFNELLEESLNTLEIFPASQMNEKKRATLAKAKATLDPKDRTHLSLALPKLPPGEYVVEWRVLSRDGHSAPGRLTFKVLEPK